jgi:hypothetical protein
MTATPNRFRVEKFTNTVQLSIGQLVPVNKVEAWCCAERIQVECVGMVEDGETESIDLNDRPDALELAGKGKV